MLPDWTFMPGNSISDSQPIGEFPASVFERAAIIETVIDVEKALRKTKENQFDVIMSDVNMGGIFGIELYK
jgi:CheY-like chemotaxis protein